MEFKEGKEYLSPSLPEKVLEETALVVWEVKSRKIWTDGNFSVSFIGSFSS